MSIRNKTLKINRTFGIILLYVLCLAGIIFVPIRNINVVLQMGISGAKDGTEIELVVEKDGEVLIADRQPVYGGKAEFSLNPNYYHADSFMIATDPENQGIS